MEVCGDDEKQGMAYCRYYRNCTYDNRVLLHYTEKYTHRIYKRKNNLDKWGDKMSQVENKTIYIKASQSKKVTNKRIVLSDVLDILSLDNNAMKRAGDIVLHTVKGDKNEKVIFSITKVMYLTIFIK